MKRTKILATYGPAVNSPETLRKLINAGANAFRVNCSHGDGPELEAAAEVVKKARSKAPYPVGMLFDISGPKLRLDRFEGSPPIKKDQELTLTTGKTDLTRMKIGVNHPAIIESVKKGERLFIDDGNLLFDIVRAGRTSITARAFNAGTLLPGKGINLPDTDIKIPTITEKDRRDIKTAVKVEADYIALSFVRSGDDIIEARKLIKRHGGRQQVIAKLEKREAIGNIEEIMMLSDGVMIARGDLGVELPPEELPKLQKRIIRMANCHHKPVIVATQMLESMRTSPRATRAEVNDVASAVFDYADAVMLSAETATGDYPVKAVTTMREVIEATEEETVQQHPELDSDLIGMPIPYAIAQAVSRTDQYCETDLIFAFTTSGFTAALISNLFPPQPVVVMTHDDTVMNQLTLLRSVYPIKVNQPTSFDDMLTTVNRICRTKKLARKGRRVIITGGAPFGSTVPTNVMLIHEVV